MACSKASALTFAFENHGEWSTLLQLQLCGDSLLQRCRNLERSLHVPRANCVSNFKRTTWRIRKRTVPASCTFFHQYNKLQVANVAHFRPATATHCGAMTALQSP